MTPKQEEVAEKLIHHLQKTKKKESIYVTVTRFFSTEEINEVNFGSQLLPFLQFEYNLIRKVGSTQLYELTNAGVDFVSFDELREEQEEEKKRIDTSHLLNEKQLEQIEVSRIVSIRAEKRANISLIIAILTGIIGVLTIWFSLMDWI